MIKMKNMLFALLITMGIGSASSMWALSGPARARIKLQLDKAIEQSDLAEAKKLVDELRTGGEGELAAQYGRRVAEKEQAQQQAIQASQEAAQSAQSAQIAAQSARVGVNVEAISTAAREASESAEAARSALRQAEIAAQRAGTQQAKDAVRQAQDAVRVAEESEDLAIQTAAKALLQAGAAEEVAGRAKALEDAINTVTKAYERVQKAINAEQHVYKITKKEFKNIIEVRDNAIKTRDAAIEALKLVKEAPTAQQAQVASENVQESAQQAYDLADQVIAIVAQELVSWQEQRQQQAAEWKKNKDNWYRLFAEELRGLSKETIQIPQSIEDVKENTSQSDVELALSIVGFLLTKAEDASYDQAAREAFINEANQWLSSEKLASAITKDTRLGWQDIYKDTIKELQERIATVEKSFTLLGFE